MVYFNTLAKPYIGVPMVSISFRNSYTHCELLPETETRKGAWEKLLSWDLSQFDLTDFSVVTLSSSLVLAVVTMLWSAWSLT